MRANDSQPSDAEALPPLPPPSWHSPTRNIAMTLAYFALVILAAAYLTHILPVENPLVIVVSTLVIATTFSPLLIYGWRHRRRPRTIPEGAARSWVAVRALLGAIILAIPLYTLSVLGLRWAVHLVAHQVDSGAAPMVIILATLVALVGSTALFVRLYSPPPRPAGLV
jgi:hypothetical protein